MSETLQRGTDRAVRLARATRISGNRKLCPADRATALLEAIIETGERVAIEGDNQEQADFLAAALAKADPARLHDLHMVAVGAGAARTSRRVRARHRQPAGFRLRRPADRFLEVDQDAMSPGMSATRARADSLCSM